MGRNICNFPRTELCTLVLCIWLWPVFVNSNPYDYELFSAHIGINYTDLSSGIQIHKQISGRFAVSSPVKMGPEFGRVIHVQNSDKANHACDDRDPVVNAPESGHWIALIQRGYCKFGTKVKAAREKNASAVVVYNHVDEKTLITMDHYVDDIVSVFIHKEDGETLAKLVDNNVRVTMNISVGEVLTTLSFNENGTLSSSQMPTVKNINLLIISLTFVLLLIIGLVCVLVYAVKRSKYMQAKNRARDMIFTVDTSNEGKEARVRLLNSCANPNAALPSVSVQQVPMQPQHTHLDQPVV